MDTVLSMVLKLFLCLTKDLEGSYAREIGVG